MSKYMDYFYIFSKLTTSIVLILIIIILGYSLVNSYQGIDKASIKLNTKIDSLSNLNTNNKKEVISLNNKINNTDAEIKEIKKLLKQITKNTSAIKQQDQIKAILESLTLLQKEFKDFSELNKLKDMKNNTLIVNNSPNELK
ncbi:hypothetical protein OAK12_01865, partial [Alphaproteobacteria bacterium]|nr:hypothetical protein [Alphaproteobacteria bacterium]